MQSSACCWLLAGSLLLVTPGRSEDGHEEHSHHPPKGPGSGHWNYGGQTAWSLDFHHCGGEAQSPIDIQLNNTLFEPWLLPILVAGYDVPEEEKLRLRNNGHTVVLDLPDTLLIHGGLPEQYRASQLHFHWGSLDTPGSEHSVDGQRFPGEIHVVHYSTNYSSIKEAMMQPGGLAVLGAFIEAGLEENPTYEYLLNYFPQVINEGQETEVPGFNIRGLLPDQLNKYYRYNGSLTTPPCFQSVNWTVFNDTIKLSMSQISFLEDTLHGDDDEILHLNFRDPQKMHGRVIMANFLTNPVNDRRGPVHDPELPPESPAPDVSSEVPEEDPELPSESPAPGDSSVETSDKAPEEDPGLPPEPPAPGDSSVETSDKAPEEDAGLPPESPTPGDSKAPEEDADGESRGADASQPRNNIPDNGVTEQHHASTLGTGDMLAIIFGILFGVTALAFFIYARRQKSRSRRLNTENKPNVIYKAATLEENIA